MCEFTKNLDELLQLATQKINLVSHLKKNYKENIHFIIEKNKNTIKQKGGQNKITYLLTEKAFELLKKSFNLRNRYIVNVSDTIKCVNIGMCIENQTIGFIENTFIGVVEVKRQYVFTPFLFENAHFGAFSSAKSNGSMRVENAQRCNNYRVDLYFPDYKLVVECDENNHDDRDPIQERIREDYILSLGNRVIRYNPNEITFDLSNVLREINKILLLSS